MILPPICRHMIIIRAWCTLMEQSQATRSSWQVSPVYLTRRPSISRWVAFSDRAVDCQLGKSKSTLNPGMPPEATPLQSCGPVGGETYVIILRTRYGYKTLSAEESSQLLGRFQCLAQSKASTRSYRAML